MSINYRELRSIRKNGGFSTIRHDNRLWLKCATMAFLAIIILLIGIGCAMASNNVDMYVISTIESSNNPDAYNKRSGARGLCQITPIVLKEFNKMTGKHYSKDDLFIDQVNLIVADWYMNRRIPQLLKHYGIKDNVRNRLIAYNYGIGNMRKGWFLPKETRDYLVKYERLS